MIRPTDKGGKMSYWEKMFHVCIIAWGVTFLSAVAYGNETNEAIPPKKPLSLQIETKLKSFESWTAERPAVISNWATNEWEEIKEFQKANWEQGKEQNAQNFAKVKNFFTSLVNKE